MLRRPSPAAVLEQVREVVATGTVVWSRRAQRRAYDRGLDIRDCVDVLRTGSVEELEIEHGTRRYRVHANGVTLVIVPGADRGRVSVIGVWRD